MEKKKTTKKQSAKKVVKKEKKAVENKPKVEGLGDVVEVITEKTGIKKAVKAVFGDDCGCEERKEKLNALLSWKVECLDKYEYEILDEFFAGNPKIIRPSQWRDLAAIARRIFNRRIENDMGCGGCVREVVGKLKKVYEAYEEKD
jgi:hypothetical protein|tara:strand:- start:9263 stop:9697 length:435 start_codon:yes stop_codon:yes gene_type:complete